MVIPVNIENNVYISVLIIAQLAAPTLVAIASLCYARRKYKQELLEMRNAKENHSALLVDLREKLDTYWQYSLKNNDPAGLVEDKTGFSNTTRSLFSYRKSHFDKEKRRIAEHFVSEFMARLKGEVDRLKDVNKIGCIFLLLDSGSTVYQVFEVLCNAYYVGGFDLDDNAKKVLFSKIVILTNNVAGANKLSEIGRVGDHIAANMALKCLLLPGKVEGKYNAVLSGETAMQIKPMIEEYSETGKNNFVYGVITGNYLSTKDGILSRGEYHDVVKKNIIKNSHNVYILSPLGKLTTYSCDDLNAGVKDNVPVLFRHKKYKAIAKSTFMDFADSDFYRDKTFTLITTCEREYGREGENMPQLSQHLNNAFLTLRECEKNSSNRFKLKEAHFDPRYESEQVIHESPIDRYEALLKYEFPHLAMRDFMRNELLKRNSS